MADFKEDLFDEKKVLQSVSRGKKKSLWNIVIVSMLVSLLLAAINFGVYLYTSHVGFKQWDANVRLSTPNGYISETADTLGLLGGTGQYQVSKEMKIKSVAIEQKQYNFGLLPSLSVSRFAGGRIGVTGEDWQYTYKSNGWRDLLFFHPDIKYKKYTHDETLLNEIGENQIVEVALSFDKPYTQSELPIYDLPAMTWFWLNTYDENQYKTYQQEAEESDWSSTFISENDALGFSVRTSFFSPEEWEQDFGEFLELLKTSAAMEHKKAYDQIKDKDIENVEILGVVVYGTKKDLMKYIENPIVKAVSIGAMVENY